MTLIQDLRQEFVPHVYDWQGSPFEIGRQHGQTLRSAIIDEYNRSLGMLCERSGYSESHYLARHRAQFETVFQDLVPRAVEEIRGLAQGAGLPYDLAFFAATRDGIKTPEPRDGCTAFYAGHKVTASGNILLGQTKDTGAPLSRYRVMKLRYSDGQSTVVLNYAGWVANIGLSSNGMAFTGNSLYAQASKEETVPFTLLKRLTMEKNTVGEVLQAIKGFSFENGCFTIADKYGAAVCLEWVAGKCAQTDISGRTFGHANRILAPDLQVHEDSFDSGNCELDSSRERQETVQRLLDEKKGAIDMATLKSIAGDHAACPQAICRHEEAGWGKTTAAYVADLNAGRIQICLGNPCSADWSEYSLESQPALSGVS